MTEAGGSISGTRRLLRRLRDIMAGSGTPQERLDRIVRIVAAITPTSPSPTRSLVRWTASGRNPSVAKSSRTSPARIT